MRGLFRYRGEESDTPGLTAIVESMSERERSRFSNWVRDRNGGNGKIHRKLPCFVFVDNGAESLNGSDFELTMSNGTAFIDTRKTLLPGQAITMLFSDLNNQVSDEILGEVIWISSK